MKGKKENGKISSLTTSVFYVHSARMHLSDFESSLHFSFGRANVREKNTWS